MLSIVYDHHYNANRTGQNIKLEFTLISWNLRTCIYPLWSRWVFTLVAHSIIRKIRSIHWIGSQDSFIPSTWIYSREIFCLLGDFYASMWCRCILGVLHILETGSEVERRHRESVTNFYNPASHICLFSWWVQQYCASFFSLIFLQLNCRLYQTRTEYFHLWIQSA